MKELISRIRGSKPVSVACVLAALAFLVVFYGLAAKNTPESTALSALDFKAGRIIDDEVFYNPNTMTVAEIQTHLDKYSANCDMWGTQPIGSGRSINGVAVNPNISRREYAAQMRAAGRSDYHDAPYVCISKYYENPTTHKTNFDTNAVAEAGMISAAQIIYNAAHQYNINPQVLLVMLKKESYVWGDTWPLKNEYNTVMGYACPDNAPCDAQYFGFYNQVMKAAWQLNYYKEHIYSYGYYPYMNNNIYYSPTYSCGYKTVYLENVATTSLYIYTPYTPNDAALAAYPGEAYCGSYGNRNFFMFFNEWFGSALATSPESAIDKYYNSSKELQEKLGSKVGGVASNEATGIFWQAYQNGFILGSDKTGYWESYGGIRDTWEKLGFEGGKLGFPIGKVYYSSTTGLYWQNFQNGLIVGTDKTGYYESSGRIREIWQKYSFESGKLGFPLSDIVEDDERGFIYQEYQGGVVLTEDGTNYFITRKEFLTAWENLNSEGRDLGKIVASFGNSSETGIYWQNYQNGLIVGSGKTGYYESSGKIRDMWQKYGFEGGKLGFPTSKIVTDSENSIIYQEYQNGIILSTDNGATYKEVSGKIYTTWNSLSKSGISLGYPIAAVGSNSATGITWQAFENGFILGSDKTGYYESSGRIRDAWQVLGFEGGKLGFPIAKVYSNEATGIKWQQYQNGFILGSDKTGYYESSGRIRDAWQRYGFEGGKLGFPMGNIYSNSATGISWQVYENGLIVGSEKTGYFESSGAIRDIWQTYGFEGGKLGFPIGDIITGSDGSVSQKYENGTIYCKTNSCSIK